MRTIVGALVVGVVLRVPPADSVSIQTVAQNDASRSYIDSPTAAVSADGRTIAFTSYAQLAPADTNRQRDIYVLDRGTGQVTLESVTLEGRASGVDSSHPGISGDGRFLVYETGLSAATVQTGSNIVLRDRQAATTRVLSVGLGGEPANGWSRTPSISRDGRVVAFSSSATNLVKEPDANGAGEDIYLVELRSGIIRRVSVDSGGVQPSVGSSVSPTVSADGRYIAFASAAPLQSPPDRPETSLVGAGTGRQRALSQVYVHDTDLKTTRRVGIGPGGRAPDGESWGSVISANGGHVAFVSAATNLTADDRNGAADVFIVDLQTGSIELISRSARNGSGNGASGHPALSADGRFVGFQSEASDLVCGRCRASAEDINLLWDVFLYDRQTTAMMRLSADVAGGWMEASRGPALDAAGEVVAFSSRHPIDATDKKNDFDLFIVRRPSTQ